MIRAATSASAEDWTTTTNQRARSPSRPGPSASAWSRAAACAGLLASFATGCVPPPAYVAPEAPSLDAWRHALAELRALGGETAGGEPRTLKLSLALREPVSGRRMEARGAVALAPKERAVRMILVGPGGTTAFDLWIRDDLFRVSIPAVDLLRRGDARTPKAEMRGLPVDFLRWWLLDPTRGDLLWADSGPRGARYVLREGGAIIELLVRPDRRIAAERRTWSEATSAAGRDGGPVLLDEEKVEADRIGCGRARYTQASTGVEIEITCEGVEPNPPSDRAFQDPDALEQEGDAP